MKKNSFARAAEAALIALALSVMAVLAFSVQRVSDESGLAALSAVGGWYRVEDGERVSVELPDVLGGGAPVALYTDALTAADAGRVFSAQGVQYGLEIWLGDKLLYRYEPTAFPRNRQMMGKLWAEVLLPEETGSAPLCLRFTDPDAHMRLSAPVVGSASAVTGYHLRSLSVSAVLTLFMLTIGLLSLVAFAYMGHKRLKDSRFLDAAVFLLLCSLWSWTDSGLLQVYGSQVASWSMVSFFAFMLMGVPMLHFVANTVRPSLRRVPRVCALLFAANALAQGVARLAFGIRLIDMLPVTHVLLTLSVGAMMAVLQREYAAGHDKNVRFCRMAFIVLGIFGVVALALYWAFYIYWYDVVYQIGVVLFILIVFHGLIGQISDDVQFRVEQSVSQRMALQDGMTDFKSAQALEKKLTALHQHAQELSNAALVYVHLRDLKAINDLHGMKAGDEAVVAAAQCISDAFPDHAAWKTSFYRVSEDEFAVVQANPILPLETLEAKLHENAMRLNRLGRRMSGALCLVCGYSFLRAPDGETQTVSDWKESANAMLQARLSAEKNWGGLTHEDV